MVCGAVSASPAGPLGNIRLTSKAVERRGGIKHLFDIFNRAFYFGSVTFLQLIDPSPSKADRARGRLLEAALAVFGEKGLKGATVREIAAAAGQNVASIAYYFGGKKQLYRAVLEAIVRELRRHVGDVVVQAAALRQTQPPCPREARRLLRLFLTTVYLRLLSRTEVVAIGRIVVREQTQPSPAFEILYDQAFREFHEMLCFLVGTATGTDPAAKENIIRTHALMGQVWFFVVGRETILRRLGWRSLEGPNADRVAAIFCENIDLVIAGLGRLSRAGTKTAPHDL